MGNTVIQRDIERGMNEVKTQNWVAYKACIDNRYKDDCRRLRQWFSQIDKPTAVEVKSEANIKKLQTNNFLLEIACYVQVCMAE